MEAESWGTQSPAAPPGPRAAPCIPSCSHRTPEVDRLTLCLRLAPAVPMFCLEVEMYTGHMGWGQRGQDLQLAHPNHTPTDHTNIPCARAHTLLGAGVHGDLDIQGHVGTLEAQETMGEPHKPSPWLAVSLSQGCTYHREAGSGAGVVGRQRPPGSFPLPVVGGPQPGSGPAGGLPPLLNPFPTANSPACLERASSQSGNTSQPQVRWPWPWLCPVQPPLGWPGKWGSGSRAHRWGLAGHCRGGVSSPS